MRCTLCFLPRSWGFRVEDFDLTETLGEAIGLAFTAGLRMADMNGDGMQDAIHIADGVLSYRLYLGFGRWSDWIDMTGYPLEPPPSGFEFTDLNGDGLSDILSVEADEVRYALNRNGRELGPMVSSRDVEEDRTLIGWDQAIDLAALPPGGGSLKESAILGDLSGS